ncbi:MAG TPA: CDP-alcohol phosphatidyltransferase family protein [Longimicrobiaceae bacterium]|nr:CDP-alcohol phosphatidyltransferase family protein [Longimicrobiaceae bacterium]
MLKFQPSAFRAQVTRLAERPLRALVRWRVKPNLITTFGFLVNVAAGVCFMFGRLGWGGFLVLFGGIVDIADGYVARATGQASRFGSFYDSTLDRIAEIVVFLGVFSLYLGNEPNIGEPWMVYVVALAMTGSLMVSYTRARAEGLGIDCKVGLMQRAERIILLGGATFLFGPWRGGLILNLVVFAMAILTNLTALYRIYWVYRYTRAQDRPAAPAAAAPPRPAREPVTR